MTAEEFQRAFHILVGPWNGSWPLKELADELDVPWQDIAKAFRSGCDGGLAAAMRLASEAKLAGRAWRKNEVAIVVRNGRFELDI